MSVIKIYVNGEIMVINNEFTISKLISDLDLVIDKIAIEKNKEIVHLEEYSKVYLKDGDCLEVIHFVGGG